MAYSIAILTCLCDYVMISIPKSICDINRHLWGMTHLARGPLPGAGITALDQPQGHAAQSHGGVQAVHRGRGLDEHLHLGASKAELSAYLRDDWISV